MRGEQGLLQTDLRLLKWEIDYTLDQIRRDKEYDILRLKSMTMNLLATISEEQAKTEEAA